MYKKGLFALAAIIVLMQTQICWSGDQALPMRKDCIVEIQIDWPANLRPIEREELINEISHAISLSAASGGPDVAASQAIPKNERNTIYLQLESNCTERLDIARSLVSYVNETVPQSPSMVVLQNDVEPGLDTIDVWGPSWSDRPD